MKKFNILLAVFLFAFLFSANQSFGQLSFYDGFESGNLTSGTWKVSGSASVSSQFPATGSFCVKGPDTWGISKTINSSASNFTFIEFKTKASQNNTTCLVFRILDSLAHTSAGMIFNNLGQIIGVNGTGMGSSVVIMQYDTGRWYSFKFVMNMTSRTYDMYIDNVLKADDFAFSSPGFTTTNIFSWSAIAASGINWIDDVKMFGAPTSVKEVALKEDVNIFPNPFQNALNILTKPNETYKAIIYDMCGKVVYEKEIAGETDIDLTQLAPGVYFTRITNNETRISVMEKVIKQ